MFSAEKLPQTYSTEDQTVILLPGKDTVTPSTVVFLFCSQWMTITCPCNYDYDMTLSYVLLTFEYVYFFIFCYIV